LLAIKACQSNENFKLECYEWGKSGSGVGKRQVLKRLIQQGQYEWNDLLLDRFLQDLPILARSFNCSLKILEFAKWLFPKESHCRQLYERMGECVGKLDEEREEELVKFLLRKIEEGGDWERN
jgi:hypothetical protein